MNGGGRSTPERPLVAVITNVQTPYRLHLHRRIAAEIPELRLASLFTHGAGDQPWDVREAPEINPVAFGPRDAANEAYRARFAMREWRKGGRMIGWLRGAGARAVVINGYNDPGRLRIIAWCRHAGVPCFLSSDSNIHADRATGLKRWAKRIIVGGAVRACAGVMPCGRAGAAYYAAYGARPEQTYLFPCNPDYSLIERVPAAGAAEAAARLGLDPSRRRLMYCGRLVPAKGVDTLIDAFVRIADRRPGWDLLLVGDGPLRAALQARVPAPLRDRVIFAGFVGDTPTVAALFRSSNLYVHAARFEPWGIVVTEAAAAGLGIVCSSVVGAAEDVVRDGVNGRSVPPDDPPAWERAILEGTEADRWRAWGEASRGVLAGFRAASDPIAALRRALGDAGVLEAGRTHAPSERLEASLA